MELRQIKYFLALSDELSFTRAAKKLHVSQPPLSFQLASLEAELGVRLFDRTSRSVQLSAAGQAFLPHARAVMARLDEATNHVKRVADGLEGRVRVGLTGSHFFGPFPRFVVQFRSLRPSMEVSLQEMTPNDQLAALHDTRLDVCVSRNPAQADAHITSSLLWRDPVVVIVPPNHAFAGRKQLALGELRNEEFVSLRLDSSPFAKQSFEACLAHGFTPKIVQQVIELPAAVNLVAAGLGVALVPLSLAHGRAGELRVFALKQPYGMLKLKADVYLLCRKGDTSPAVTEFTHRLRQWANGQKG